LSVENSVGSRDVGLGREDGSPPSDVGDGQRGGIGKVPDQVVLLGDEGSKVSVVSGGDGGSGYVDDQVVGGGWNIEGHSLAVGEIIGGDGEDGTVGCGGEGQ